MRAGDGAYRCSAPAGCFHCGALWSAPRGFFWLQRQPSLLLLDGRSRVHPPDHDPPGLQLADRGITILMSTHDMLAARESCSRLCGEMRGNIHWTNPATSFSLNGCTHWLHGHDIEEARSRPHGLHLAASGAFSW